MTSRGNSPDSNNKSENDGYDYWFKICEGYKQGDNNCYNYWLKVYKYEKWSERQLSRFQTESPDWDLPHLQQQRDNNDNFES
jgi:hypothetical protein